MGRLQRLLSFWYIASRSYRGELVPQWLQDARWDGRHETSDGEGVKHPSIIIIIAVRACLVPTGLFGAATDG
jgi:hypothetical protein